MHDKSKAIGTDDVVDADNDDDDDDDDDDVDDDVDDVDDDDDNTCIYDVKQCRHMNV